MLPPHPPQLAQLSFIIALTFAMFCFTCAVSNLEKSAQVKHNTVKVEALMKESLKMVQVKQNIPKVKTSLKETCVSWKKWQNISKFFWQPIFQLKISYLCQKCHSQMDTFGSFLDTGSKHQATGNALFNQNCF